jgi:HTH-type transcriptional regulator/antitoxin HigA
MDIRPIHTEEEYDAALADVEQYFADEPARGTPEADRFEILLALIGNYEQNRWAIDPPADPVEAITLIMQDRNLDQKDLAILLGSRSRASELLRRVRPLSMEQAQVLYREWRVPAECLLATAVVKQTARRRRIAPRTASSSREKHIAPKAPSAAQKKRSQKMPGQKDRTPKRSPPGKRASRGIASRALSSGGAPRRRVGSQ